ncbi:chondroitinase-B domain-containing protein [Paenibacillus allorhizosphaerae]|uniref:F5/8 type C domain-containing protein n=1 Tax=Paenibacillus allorhizosphaerae TaxID=2849866 RepID=A0ABM8VFW4_9BACL|nr:chondroitinase-B domain-containing protein [Paenibacillus allorhizosphaerae]CAG7636071.1 hypothetical protein PAECIP111802_02213 [Paenibacillus allorhizosphaerae]
MKLYRTLLHFGMIASLTLSLPAAPAIGAEPVPLHDSGVTRSAGPVDAISSAPLAASVVNVSSPAQLETALAGASAGTTIVLANGIYTKNSSFTISGKQGTETNPIIIKAANQGQAEISGGAYMTVSGSSYVVIDGLKFTNTGNNAVAIDASHHVRVTNSRFDLNEDGANIKWLNIRGSNSHHNRIDHNEFANKTDPGPVVAVDGNGSTNMAQYTLIEYNYFKNVGPRIANGLETIRLGLSGVSLLDGFSTVQYNLFEDCDGDPEVVSVKSSSNEIRYNTFRNSQGQLTLRHGNNNSVYGNYFFGDGIKSGVGGIRIYGTDHKIYNNYMEKLTGDTLSLDGGDFDGGPDSKDYVSGDLTKHWRVYRTQVAFNTIVDSKTGIMVGKSYTYPPVDSVLANNIVNNTTGTLYNEYKPGNTAFEGNIGFGSTLTNGSRSAAEVRSADPLFTVTDGMKKLSAGSPAIDSASGSYAYVAEDMDGQARNGSRDAGADEYSVDPIVRGPLSPPVTPIPADAEFTTFIEAEDASIRTEGFAKLACSACSGGAYMQSPGAGSASDQLVYRINVSHGGTLYLHLLGKTADASSGGTRDFLVSVDGGQEAPAAAARGDWGWTTAQAPIALTDGTHDVTIRPVTPGAGLDRIALSKSGKPPVESPLPKLDGIQVNGIPVPDFAPSQYSYTYKLPLGTSGIPAVTASSSHTVEIVPPQETFGTAVIYVRDRQDRYFYSRYEVRLTGLPVYGSVTEPLLPYGIAGVTASPGYHASYPPPNTIDGTLSTRWAAKGEHWIRFDLGESKPLQYALIAFLNGDKDKYSFDLDLSNDGVAWKRVFSGASSGQTSDLELFAFEQTPARYVLFSGHGNTKDAWNNINEFIAAGRAVATKLTLPSVSATYSDSVTLSALLTDADGTPLANQTVGFTVNHEPAGTAVTDSSGKAAVSLRVNAGAAPETDTAEYPMEAVYAGAADRSMLGSNAAGVLMVGKEEANVVYTGSAAVPVGAKSPLSAAVTQQDDGEPGSMLGLPVRFDVRRLQTNGQAVPYAAVTVTSDAYGRAAAETNLTAGLYEVKAALGGNPYYKALEASPVTVAVYSPGASSVQANGFIELDDTSSLIGSKAKKLHLESRWERTPQGGITGYARFHSEPQGLRLTMTQAEWLVTAGTEAYIQGKATDDNGAVYTVRIRMDDASKPSSILTVQVWQGQRAEGNPLVNLQGKNFKGQLSIK